MAFLHPLQFTFFSSQILIISIVSFTLVNTSKCASYQSRNSVTGWISHMIRIQLSIIGVLAQVQRRRQLILYQNICSLIGSVPLCNGRWLILYQNICSLIGSVPLCNGRWLILYQNICSLIGSVPLCNVTKSLKLILHRCIQQQNNGRFRFLYSGQRGVYAFS